MVDQQLKGEPLLREMYRKSMDTICVYNPTDEDFYVIWDGFKHLIPNKNKDVGFGKGKKHVPRYIANKYAKDMKDKLINEMQDKALKEKIEELTKKGADDPLVRANLQFEVNKGYRTDNPELIKQIYEKIILGVVEYYGLGQEEETSAGEVADQRPIEEQIMDTMERRYTEKREVRQKPIKEYQPEAKPEEQPVEDEDKYPINKFKNKKELIEEVAQV